jgi:hypothetical protein
MNSSYLLLAALLGQPPASPGPDAAGYNGESFKMFPAKVQPVLSNLCANCHAKPDHASGFKLARVAEGYANPRAIGQNVRAAAAFLTRDDPASSPLLAKALTAHGSAKEAPLSGRGHPAYKNLELWAAWAVLPEGSPMPQAIPGPVAKATTSEPARLPLIAAEPAKPEAKENPLDPFDPETFNRQR